MFSSGVNKAGCISICFLTSRFHLPASSAEIQASQFEDDLSQRMNYAAAVQGLEAMLG